MEFIKEENRIYSTDDSGSLLAEITFPEKESGVFCIDHTFVHPSMGGQGIAGKLTQMAVDAIKEKGGKVTATCSYAVKWLEKHPVD
ncbi:MAG: N-acetyltransferase [Eubacterium sp.]|nr:N-acetyltransferase [Eubacterium sp.]